MFCTEALLEENLVYMLYMLRNFFVKNGFILKYLAVESLLLVKIVFNIKIFLCKSKVGCQKYLY